MTEFFDSCAALGRDRLALAESIQSPEEWKDKWKDAKHEYPFTWGECWKAHVVFAVPHFEAELGFYLDILGFGMNAMWDNHAMLVSPDKGFSFVIKKGSADMHARPATVHLEFMLGNIEEAFASLRARGVPLTTELVAEWGEDNAMRTCGIKTPSGYCIKLWGMVQTPATS
jgi:Glyoxalase/Bleomycin resistance protein/Dioxygenase superfamily